MLSTTTPRRDEDKSKEIYDTFYQYVDLHNTKYYHKEPTLLTPTCNRISIESQQEVM